MWRSLTPARAPTHVDLESAFLKIIADNQLINLNQLKVECLLTSAIWSYGHEAEVYIFLNLPFPSNPKENSSIRCILSTPEQNLL